MSWLPSLVGQRRWVTSIFSRCQRACGCCIGTKVGRKTRWTGCGCVVMLFFAQNCSRRSGRNVTGGILNKILENKVWKNRQILHKSGLSLYCVWNESPSVSKRGIRPSHPVAFLFIALCIYVILMNPVLLLFLAILLILFWPASPSPFGDGNLVRLMWTK